MRIILFFFVLIPFLLIIGITPVFAGSENEFSPSQDLITRAIDIKEDLRGLGKYILYPDKNAIIKLLGVAGGTAGLILIDEDIRHEVKKRSGETLDAMERIFEPMGRWEIQGILGGGFLGTGYLIKDGKMVDASLTGFESYFISGTLVEVIKLISGRERPREEEGSDAFFKGGFSFPSGHAARSFAWASSFCEYYHDKKIVPILSYSLATLVSLSRLETDRHWASDVFFGACLGFSIGKGLSHLHLRAKDIPITISPYINEDVVGLSSSLKF